LKAQNEIVIGRGSIAWKEVMDREMCYLNKRYRLDENDLDRLHEKQIRIAQLKKDQKKTGEFFGFFYTKIDHSGATIIDSKFGGSGQYNLGGYGENVQTNAFSEVLPK